jgi:hypothetical protein
VGSGWFIDGVLWTGLTKTVGSGKQYATINLAITAAAGVTCLYLVDAGTYNEDVGIPENTTAYIRGLGTSPLDTIIHGTFNQAIANTTGSIILENVWEYFYSVGGESPSILRAKGGVNKCVVGCDGGPGQSGQNAFSYTTGDLLISYTYVIRTVTAGPNYSWCYDLAYIDLSTVSLDHVSYSVYHKGLPDEQGGWGEKDCTGTLALDIKAESPAAGYGPGYGAFRITQGDLFGALSVSQSIKETRLRRATSYTGSGEIVSVSQPINDVRLRRPA